MSIQQLYDDRVKALPPMERLRLASMILGDLTGLGSLGTVPEYGDWSDEDLIELTNLSLQYADETAPWEPDHA